MWLFDTERHRFRRLPLGADADAPALDSDWEPYFSFDLDEATRRVHGALNEDGTRLLRAFRDVGPGEPSARQELRLDGDRAPERRLNRTPVRCTRGSDESAELLAGLNPVQRDAVSAPDGPVLVVAGAGSGKTRLLTHRVAYLIAERGVSPFELLAITFTNKAAGEMKERVARARRSGRPTACGSPPSTRRARGSCGARPRLLGYRASFSIYDESDAVRLVDYVRRDLNLDPKRFPPRRLHHAISAMKNELVEPEEAKAKALTPPEVRLAEVYVEYQQPAGRGLRRRLRRPAAARRAAVPRAPRRARPLAPPLRPRARRRVPGHEPRAVGARAPPHRASTATSWSSATPTRSVYRFRGADYRNLMRFEEEFPEASIIVLDQNYRSTQTILDAANAVIANNAARRPKHLWTEQVGGELITRYHAEDEHDEAELRRARDRPARGRRADPLRRRRRLLPDERAEPGRGGGVRPRRDAVPHRRWHEVLRPARDQGRARVPARRSRTPTTRWAGSASSTPRSAASATPRCARSRRTRRARRSSFRDALHEAAAAGRHRPARSAASVTCSR